MDPSTPAGWYQDGGPQLRYWDGSAWTEHVLDSAPVGSTAPISPPDTQTPPAGIAVGVSAVAAGALGAIAVCLPWMIVEAAGIALLLAAFVLSAIALTRERSRWLGAIGLVLAVLGTILGVVMFIVGFMNGYAGAVDGIS